MFFLKTFIVISGTEHKMKLKLSRSTFLTHISLNTILEYYHASVINRSMIYEFLELQFISVCDIMIKYNLACY